MARRALRCAMVRRLGRATTLVPRCHPRRFFARLVPPSSLCAFGPSPPRARPSHLMRSAVPLDPTPASSKSPLPERRCAPVTPQLRAAAIRGGPILARAATHAEAALAARPPTADGVRSSAPVLFDPPRPRSCPPCPNGSPHAAVLPSQMVPDEPSSRSIPRSPTSPTSALSSAPPLEASLMVPPAVS